MNDLIAKIEGIVGANVPEDLLSFYNGEFPDIILPAQVMVSYSSDITGHNEWLEYVEWLVDAKIALSYLEGDLKSMEYNDREVPANTLPVGCNDENELYVCSLREQDYGTIYFMFHESADPLDESLQGAMRAAGSFSEWIGSFRKAPEREPEPDWEAIHAAKIQEILNRPRPPWWKFWVKR